MTLLVQLIVFTVIAAAIYAIVHHYFALFIYRYKLRDDWTYIMGGNDFGYLFRLQLIFYGIASAVLFIILLFAKSTSANRRWLIMVIIIVIMSLLFGLMVGNLLDLLTIRAFTETIIYLLPTFLIKYLLKNPIVINKQAV